LNKIIRKYLSSWKAEEKIISASRYISDICTKIITTLNRNSSNKFEIVVTPEDICLVIFFNMSIPFIYAAFKTGWWLWILESYACIIAPSLFTFHALESGNNEKVGYFLVYWIFGVGLPRVIESLINFRMIFPIKYILLKAALAIIMTNPKFDGIAFIMKKRNVTRKLINLKQLHDEINEINDDDKESSDDDILKVGENSDDDDCMKVDEEQEIRKVSEDIEDKDDVSNMNKKILIIDPPSDPSPEDGDKYSTNKGDKDCGNESKDSSNSDFSYVEIVENKNELSVNDSKQLGDEIEASKS